LCSGNGSGSRKGRWRKEVVEGSVGAFWRRRRRRDRKRKRRSGLIYYLADGVKTEYGASEM
jgi:hypothetical protein